LDKLLSKSNEVHIGTKPKSTAANLETFVGCRRILISRSDFLKYQA
jgi:hypothetical protein